MERDPVADVLAAPCPLLLSLLAPLQRDERFNAHTIPLHIVDRILTLHPDITAFIETGTYTGETVEHVKHQFERVYTIELSPDLWRHAQTRFASVLNVHVLLGDSGKLLPGVLAGTSHRRALVWLDAHYSGNVTARGETDSAIIDELNAFKNGERRDHVLMIDDLDDFTGKNGYPTLDELVQHVREINPTYTIDKLDLRRGVLVAR